MSEAVEKPTQSIAKSQWQAEVQERAKKGKRHPVKLKPAEDNPEALEVAYPLDETQVRTFETTGFSDKDAGMKLLSQVANAQASSEAVFNQNAAFAMLNGIAPENPLEGLLAAQAVAAHNLSMEFSRRAMVSDKAEDVDRNINRASKMMRAFTAQVEALQKLRSKGQQTIQVQHIQVNQGGSAIVGDVHQGAGGSRA